MKQIAAILVLLVIVAAMILFDADKADAQIGGPLTPYSKGVLDLYYLQTNSSINGELIIDFTITTNKLAFSVVTNEVDPVHAAWTNSVYVPHTNNASAHHVRFANSDEIDPVFTNWLDTSSVVLVESDPVFTNWLATNTVTEISLSAGMLINSNGYTSPILTQSVWFAVNAWTSETPNPYITYNTTGITFNLPANRTADVSIITSIGSTIAGAGKDVTHAFFINGSRTHADINVQGVRRTYGAGNYGATTVGETHFVVDGDFIDFRIRNLESVAGNPQITIAGGSLVVRGRILP